MRHEYLIELDTDALDSYARAVGADVSSAHTKAEKVSAIEERRAHVAHVSVLGLTCDVPIKRVSDARVTSLLDRMSHPGMTNEQCDQLLLLLLGREQHDAVVERCTDEDGVVDQDAFAVALAQLVGSEDLKN